MAEVPNVIQRTVTPFSGNFYDSHGRLRNIDGDYTTYNGYNAAGTQINGNFYDHEGNIRNIDEILNLIYSGTNGTLQTTNSDHLLIAYNNFMNLYNAHALNNEIVYFVYE